MTSVLKSMSKQTLLYGGGFMLKRAIGFLMVPFYTRFLRPEQYGVLELLDLSSMLLAFIVGLGLLNGVFRFHALCETDEDRREVKSTAVLGVGIWGGIVVAVVAMMSDPLARLATGQSGDRGLFLLAVFGVYAGQLSELLLGYLRVEGRAGAFVLLSLGSTFLTISLNILFVGFLNLGVAGILVSALTGSTAICTALAWPYLVRAQARLAPRLLGQMLAYSLPFIPTGMMAFVVNFADRYFLRRYTDIDTVGIYALGYKLGMVGSMAVAMPVSLVWNAMCFEIAKSPTARPTFARIFTYYAAALFFVNGALASSARELVTIMAAPDYARAATVVPLIAAAMFFLNACDMLQLGLLMERKTGWLPLVWCVTMLINTALNLALIPAHGMYGAAVATTVAFGVHALMMLLVARRSYAVPYEWGRLIRLGVVSMGGALVLPAWTAFGPWLDLVLKSAIFSTVFAAAILAPGFLQPEEKQLLSRVWRQPRSAD